MENKLLFKPGHTACAGCGQAIAAKFIVEAAGGKIYALNGGEFFLNDYLDSQKINDHLLVVAPDSYEEVRGYLHD